MQQVLPPTTTVGPFTTTTIPQPQPSSTVSPIEIAVITEACTRHDGVQDAIKPILKQSSLSLEPNEKRSRGPTPRKVQFQLPEKMYGGRGLTEFSRCPSRKSHTRRALPLGMFDTDSDSQSQATLSDVESVVSDVSDTQHQTPHFDLLNNIFSQKFCQNSRLIKCVRKKKKRKEKEQQWLSLVSPDIGLQNAQKTLSRIHNHNMSMSTAGISHLPHGSNLNMNMNMNVATATMQKRPTQRAVDNNRDRYKSPSMLMSRGRRAWHKAQKQLKQTQNNNTGASVCRIASAEIVKGTPVVQKVSKIADMKMIHAATAAAAAHVPAQTSVADDLQQQQQQQPSILSLPALDKVCIPPLQVMTTHGQPQQAPVPISIEDEHGHDGDQEDNSEELIVRNNAGSIPLDMLVDAADMVEMKENSPKTVTATTTEAEADADDEALSDEMKMEPVQVSEQERATCTETVLPERHMLAISYERLSFDSEEDDDLVLQNMRNATSGSVNQASVGDEADANMMNVEEVKEVDTDAGMEDRSESLFVPTSLPQQDIIVVVDEHDNDGDGDGDVDVQAATGTSDAMNHAHQATDVNTQTASAIAHKSDIVSSEEQNHDQATNTMTATVPDNVDSITCVQPINRANVSFASVSYARSIGTQTEGIQCEIGIQCNMDQLHPFAMCVNNSEPLLRTSGQPLVIETSFGTRFQRIDHTTTNENITAEVGDATEATAAALSPIHETDRDERVQPEAIQLQALSLNIQQSNNNNNNNANNANNNLIKNTRKRTYADCMMHNDVDDGDDDDDDDVDLVAYEVALQTTAKRRKIDECKAIQITAEDSTEHMTFDAYRTKYQKMEFVWVRYAGQLVPSLILDCVYDENERFYPEHYRLLWITYIDSEGDREGKTSISEASYKDVTSRITEQQIADFVKNDNMPKAAWNELRQYKPDFYQKYFDGEFRRRRSRNKKGKQKRRASVM